nr:hypothetical protein [uncultured Mucilaginibacter sp.]
MGMLDSLYLFFEVLAFVVAAVQYRQMKHTQYRYFVPYMLYIVLYEVAAIYNVFNINHRNLWISNISMTISFLFYSVFLLKLLKTPVFQKRIKWAIGLILLCSAVNMAFFQGFWDLDTVTILLQYVVIIISSCLYFYELMNFTTTQLTIIRMPGFWLNTGLLFFCLINFLFFSSFAYMAYKNNYQYFLLFRGIANISIAILYSCLTVSFLCFRKTTSRLL